MAPEAGRRARRRLRPRATGLACALAAAGLLAAPIDALADGRFSPFIEAAIGYDDNVFRISKDLDPQATIGSASRADVYRRTLLGLNLNLALGRQRLSATLAGRGRG